MTSRMIAISLVVALHILLVTLLLATNVSVQRKSDMTTVLRILQLQSDEVDEDKQPAISSPASINEPHFSVPEFTEPENLITPDYSLPENYEQDSSVYSFDKEQIPDSDLTIFDPKLRKKLYETHQHMKAKNKELQSYRSISGDQVEEVSDSECMHTMPAIGNSTREKNWSLRYKCGKDEGDKILDAVNNDINGRYKFK